ncbi:hypothetical protein [Cypionkella sp.]|uniref:hypothetical protein n=1 Tax=Cypionkella sp. TaxID=2811411 RepID=UPI0026342BF8|nr:hypothetical protein [Cypionkella sp.]
MWQIVDGDKRSAIAELAPDFAHLFEWNTPNVQAIREFCEQIIAVGLRRIRLGVRPRPSEFEAIKRQKLRKNLQAK